MEGIAGPNGAGKTTILKLASGLCPVAALTRHGVNVALGTDAAASHNDLDMLPPDNAAMIACPANAVGEIREHVTRMNGLLCTAPHSMGCIEALEQFFG